MKKILFALLAALMTIPTFAQQSLTQTTLSASINANQTLIYVASATGIDTATLLYVDNEALRVVGVNGTSISVVRGSLTTQVVAHNSGATVYAGPAGANTPFLTKDLPLGACTNGNGPFVYSPAINVTNGKQWTCSAGSVTLTQSSVGGTFVLPCNGVVDVTASAQRALNNAGIVTLSSSSSTNVCLISSPLVMSSHTRLVVPANLTFQEAQDADFNMLVNNAYSTRATSGVSVTLSWTSGNSVSVAWTAHGLSVGQYVWIRSSTASTYTHYNGVFKVATVTDANDFTVNMDVIPPSAPPAGMVASVADVDESVEGGIWNYNGSAPTLCSGLQCNAIVFGGVENVQVKNLTVTQAEKYSVHIGAARDVVVSNIEDWNTYSDAVKLLGPIHNARVENIHGKNGDDQVTFQTDQGPSFPTYAWTEGDISGPISAKNISENDTASGALVGIIGCGSEYMGGIEVEGVGGITSSSNSALMISSACSTATVQDVVARNIDPSGGAKGLYVYPEFYGGTGATMTVGKIDFEGDLSNTSSAAPVQFNSGATVLSANLRLLYNAVPSSTVKLVLASCTTGNHCTVNSLNIDNSSVSSNFNARLVDVGPFATIGQINIGKLYDNTGANLVVTEATSIGTSQISIRDSNLTVASVANCAINCNLALNNTTVTNASGGVLAATGTVTLGGVGSGNTFAGSTVYTHTNGGTPTFNTNQEFRCLTAGAVLPIGAVTTDSTQCGTSTDTGVRVN